MDLVLDEIKEKILEIVNPYIKELDLELFELNIKKYQQTIMIEILVDKSNGGITVDKCTSINRYLNEILEEQEIFDEYTIEVSSPGLDKPLVVSKDFIRVVGRKIRCHLIDVIEGKKEHWGIIKEVKDEEVTIELKTGILLKLKLKNISKAIQVI